MEAMFPKRGKRDGAATQPVACPVCGKGGVRSLVANAHAATILIHHQDGTQCSMAAPGLAPGAKAP